MAVCLAYSNSSGKPKYLVSNSGMAKAKCIPTHPGNGKRAISDQHAWALVEVACASAPDHLVAVRRAYRSLFGCSLEEDIATCPALQQDPLGKLLVSLLRSYHCETELIDGDVTALEAAQLAEAIRKRKQPHADKVIRIVGIQEQRWRWNLRRPLHLRSAPRRPHPPARPPPPRPAALQISAASAHRPT
jgi:hypothetical protein